MKFFLITISLAIIHGSLGRTLNFGYPYGMNNYDTDMYQYWYGISEDKDVDNFDENTQGSEEYIVDVTSPINFVGMNYYDYDTDITWTEDDETNDDSQERTTENANSSEEEEEEESTTTEYSTESSILYSTSNVMTTTGQPQEYHSNLLKDIISSSSAGRHLYGQYSELMMKFAKTYIESNDEIKMLERDSDNIFRELKDIDPMNLNNVMYNGDQHQTIVETLSNMLATENKIREKILKMQSLEQKRNFHSLLNALLQEIYGENQMDFEK